MSISVRFTGPIRKAIGVQQTESSAAGVPELIDEMSARFGEPFKSEIKKTKIIVNGYAVQFYDGLKTRLKPGDTVDFVENWRLEKKPDKPEPEEEA